VAIRNRIGGLSIIERSTRRAGRRGEIVLSVVAAGAAGGDAENLISDWRRRVDASRSGSSGKQDVGAATSAGMTPVLPARSTRAATFCVMAGLVPATRAFLSHAAWL
jgi:hypothetical protein